MSAKSLGSAISRDRLDSNPQDASASERVDQVPSIENMRAVLAAQIDTLPAQIIRDMFRQVQVARKRHAIDFRVSIWLPLISRLYFNFSAGREQRNPKRLAGEGLTSSSRRAAFLGTITVVLVGFSLFGIFCFLYLAKSMFKINAYAGYSPFHPLYVLFVG